MTTYHIYANGKRLNKIDYSTIMNALNIAEANKLESFLIARIKYKTDGSDAPEEWNVSAFKGDATNDINTLKEWLRVEEEKEKMSWFDFCRLMDKAEEKGKYEKLTTREETYFAVQELKKIQEWDFRNCEI